MRTFSTIALKVCLTNFKKLGINLSRNGKNLYTKYNFFHVPSQKRGAFNAGKVPRKQLDLSLLHPVVVKTEQ